MVFRKCYDLLGDRRVDDVTTNTFYASLSYETNRFRVAVGLFSNITEFLKNVVITFSDTLACSSCASCFYYIFDVICDLLMDRRARTWNVFDK